MPASPTCAPFACINTLIPDLRPEGSLILSCIRPAQDSLIQARIQELLGTPLDWQYVLQVAEKHRITPLLHRQLASLKTSQIPTDISQELRRRFYKNAQRNLRLTKEMMRLLEMFKTQNIPVIPYKGVILSALVYKKLSIRQVWDLDVLIQKKDIDKSRNQLLKEGFRLSECFDREQSFYHEERDVELDLHWGLTPFFFPADLDFEELWANRKPVALNQETVLSFSDENLLLILCIQIAKDCWERRQHIEHLSKVCDIAALVQQSPQLDWNAVFTQARHSGIERIVHFGLRLAQGLLGAPLPAHIANKVEGDSAIARPVTQACQNLFGPLDDNFAQANDSYLDFALRSQQLRFYLDLRERPKDKFIHLKEIIKTIPNALKQVPAGTSNR